MQNSDFDPSLPLFFYAKSSQIRQAIDDMQNKHLHVSVRRFLEAQYSFAVFVENDVEDVDKMRCANCKGANVVFVKSYRQRYNWQEKKADQKISRNSFSVAHECNSLNTWIGTRGEAIQAAFDCAQHAFTGPLTSKLKTEKYDESNPTA